MDKSIKVTAYVMVPIDIEIDVTSIPPSDCRLYRDWFNNQLECGVKAFTEEHLKIENGFVDVTSFSIGDDSGGAYLSAYHDKDFVKRLTAIVEAKLEIYEKVKKAMKVTNNE